MALDQSLMYCRRFQKRLLLILSKKSSKCFNPKREITSGNSDTSPLQFGCVTDSWLRVRRPCVSVRDVLPCWVRWHPASIEINGTVRGHFSSDRFPCGRGGQLMSCLWASRSLSVFVTISLQHTRRWTNTNLCTPPSLTHNSVYLSDVWKRRNSCSL